MFTIQSRSHPYTVESFDGLREALRSFDSYSNNSRIVYLADKIVCEHYAESIGERVPAERLVCIEATEDAKSFEKLTPIFLSLLAIGLKRDGILVIIGGGVLQDIGCFIASVLFRGLRWELIPTTLLAQADSCIGSKSSINIGQYKNQIGTFYPPHRVLLTAELLATLPHDEIRSGLGEVIKLQLIEGEAGFRELISELNESGPTLEVISKWVWRSMAVKNPSLNKTRKIKASAIF